MPRSPTTTLVGSQQPTAGRPRATVRCRWPFLALAPWPPSERSPSRPSRREPCKLSVASDVDDSAPPSMPLSNASDKIQAETQTTTTPLRRKPGSNARGSSKQRSHARWYSLTRGPSLKKCGGRCTNLILSAGGNASVISVSEQKARLSPRARDPWWAAGRAKNKEKETEKESEKENTEKDTETERGRARQRRKER